MKRSIFFLLSGLVSISLNAKFHFVGPDEGWLSFHDNKRPATLRILATNDTTNNHYSLMEMRFPAGYDGPGFHCHQETIQSIYAVSGKFIVKLKEGPKAPEQRIEMAPGSYLSIPLGMFHSFLNPFEEEAIALSIDAPGNLVNMFKAMSDTARDAELSVEEKQSKLQKIRWQTYDNHPMEAR